MQTTRIPPGAPVLKAALGALLLTASIGCAGRGGPFRPEQIGRAQAVIYVYRPGSIIGPGPVRVFVDQRDVGRLAPRQYLAAVVGPGEHLVRVQRRSDATRLVMVGEGESVILQTEASLIGGRVFLGRPGEETARERIAATRRAAPVEPGDAD